MRITLVGSAIAHPSVGEAARRYNLANAYLEAALADRFRREGLPLRVTRLEAQVGLEGSLFEPGLAAEVVASAPDLLGLSCYCWDIEAQLALARTVRAELPAVRVVLGGPSASIQARELVERNPAVDAVVRGEGESTLAELALRGADLAGVAGLVHRVDGGAVREEEARPLGPDLSGIVSPLLAGVVEPPRQNLLLELSRGCRKRCAYCAWKLQGGRVRAAPEERVRAELAWAVRRGYEHAFVIDSALNDSDERLAAVARAASAADPGRSLALSYFVDLERLAPGQVPRLATLRTHEVTVGVETLSPAALRVAGRRVRSEEDLSRDLDLLAEVAPATVSLMLGLPGDDLAGFGRTLDFVARMAERPGRPRVRAARVHWTMVAPGSALSRSARRHGLEVAPRGVPYVLGSRSFPRGDMARALRLLREHPRADLFVWDDAEPLAVLEPDLPAMFVAGGDHLGGRAGRELGEREVLAAIRPLAPGRQLPHGFVVGPLERQAGFPVVVLSGPGGQAVRLQVRPAGAEPAPLDRTSSFDLVLLRPETEGPNDRALVSLLLELIRRNDR